MTYAELVNRIAEILPGATFGEDLDGQLVIYTDLMVVDDEVLLEMSEIE